MKIINNKGITLIYIAILIVVLIAMAGLAIDIGYMYVAKGQLQNASDAGALAGAANLDGTNSLTQTNARTEAVNFAGKNEAAKTSVVIASDGSNSLSQNNDITVGNWDGNNYTPGGTPVNAVQVRARRTVDSPGGQVHVFLGNILGLIGFSWAKMSAAAEAIAALKARGTAFTAVCQDFCTDNSGNPCTFPTICTLSPPRILSTGPTAPYSESFAWTTLTDDPTSTTKIRDLICGNAPNEDICGKSIYTTMGTSAVSVRDLESVFADPNLDAANKEYNGSGDVIGWWVIVPITQTCPPGKQGQWEPALITGLAKIRIIAICAPGVGTPCRPYSVSPTICNPYTPPSNIIVIDRISCISCANASGLVGLKPVLVK